MTPLSQIPLEKLAGIRGIITDVDGTLTTDGKITATALDALERAQAAGLKTIAVTGAAAGTCDAMARTWPLDAIIGESGGFVFRLHPDSGRMVHLHILPRDERRGHWAQYEKVMARIIQEVPGAALAADQAYRETDLAIDHAQDVQKLDEAAVAKIVEIMHDAGMTTGVSNIHVNGWFGPYDKLATTRLVFKDLFMVDLDDDAQRDQWIFVGDSPNDQPMFDFFPMAVGVANIIDFGSAIETPPAFVADGVAGVGFAEVVDAVLAAQSSG